MRGNDRRMRLPEGFLKKCCSDLEHSHVCICEPVVRVGARGPEGSPLVAQHACTWPRLRSQSQTSGGSLGRLCNSPGRYQMHRRHTWNNENGGRTGCLASNNERRRPRELPESGSRSKALVVLHSDARVRVQNLLRRTDDLPDQTCPVLVAMKEPKMASCGSPCRFVVLQIRVDGNSAETESRGFAGYQMPCEYGILLSHFEHLQGQ